jgi:multicomponent Na+:H+ antiporter subunit G
MEIVNQILFYLSWALLAAGGLLCVIGALGLLRFPEIYTRMHAAGVIDTGGASLILFGLMLQSGLTLETVKLAFILFFLFFTSPTAGYALARGTWSAGHRPITHDGPDEPGDGQSDDG